MDVAHPPAPWQLSATMLVSAFAVPRPRLPADLLAAVPDAVEPVTLGGRVVVGVAFARYAPGGVLAYDELLVAVLGRQRWAPRYTVGQIWVDSPASRAGARALWAIPKELATFTWSGPAASGAAASGAAASGPAGGVTRCTMSSGGREVAGLVARVGRRALPGVVVVPLTTAQVLDSRTAITRNRVVGRLRTMRPVWSFEADGPLGHLAGARPCAHFAVTEATVTFGLECASDQA